ncbi:MAG: winged helix-turn-helix domain-containing protein [Gammaproteobacteria bacterium]|nr:winged helix-turn-helix domain-containing protein [Gammaproteobacteria bacterium]
MDVLLLLARRAGEVISREELLATVWSGSVVGDDTLTQAVIKLRKALGDDTRSPSYIETIAKRGYRLIAKVRAGQGDAPVSASRSGERSAPASVSHTKRLAWAAGLALLIAVAAVSYFTALGLLRFARELPAPPAVETVAFGNMPTITVLSFDSLGEDSPDYLARGIAADLATDLAQLSEIRVIRAPLEAGLSGATGTRAVSRYVVSGNVQPGPDNIKINVWLLDAASGRQLWAERYVRPRRDLIALQEEIVDHLVQALAVKVSETEWRRLASSHTRNLKAYDLFLRAYAAHLTHQPDDNRQARELYRQAAALDPGFARAYGGLAMTYANDYRYQWSSAGADALKHAMELANTAREINPDVREVYWVLAYVHMQRHQPAQALQHLKRAIALDPSYADGYGLMGAVYGYAGEPAKALPPLRYGMRLNPDAGYLYYMTVGEAYFFLGETEQALLNLNKALARNPANLETRIFLAATHAARGDAEAAQWAAEEIRMLAPGFALPAWLETSPLTDSSQKRRVIKLLKGYGL